MKKTSKIISILLIVSIFGLVVVATVVKVSMNHQDAEILVSKRKIEEAARKCTIDGTCTNETTSLGFLIQKGYIDKQIHPITKEYINEGIPITCKGFDCIVEIS